MAGIVSTRNAERAICDRQPALHDTPYDSPRTTQRVEYEESRENWIGNGTMYPTNIAVVRATASTFPGTDCVEWSAFAGPLTQLEADQHALLCEALLCRLPRDQQVACYSRLLVQLFEKFDPARVHTAPQEVVKYGAFLRSRYFLLAARYVDGVASPARPCMTTKRCWEATGLTPQKMKRAALFSD